MEKYNKLTKQITDSIKMLLIRLDELEVPVDLIKIDHIKVKINQNSFNILRSEMSNIAFVVNENESDKIVILNKGLEIVQNQTIDKLIFVIDEIEEPVLDSIVFFIENLPELYITLQKKGLNVSKVEKEGNKGHFSLNKESLNIIFTNTPLAQNEEVLTLKTLLNQETEAKLRIMADFQNYKKRMAQLQKESLDMANKNLVDQIVEVIDDCKRAMNEDKHEGIELLLEKLMIVLKNQGLEQIDIKVGVKFNPEMMEAISSVPANEGQELNTVIHIDQLGYKYINSNKIYRSAKVIVTK